MGIGRAMLLSAGLLVPALAVAGQEMPACPTGAHEVGGTDRPATGDDDILLECACNEGRERQGDQCVAPRSAAERVAWLLEAKNIDLISGAAAGDIQDLRAHAVASIKAPDRLARLLIGLWHAHRGYYTRARLISRMDAVGTDDLTLYDFGRQLAVLEERAQLLTDDTVTLVILRGAFSADTARLMPAPVLGRLLRAHLAAKSGDIEAALDGLRRAERASLDKALFVQARLYLEQRLELEQGQARPQPEPDGLASGYAALSLGLHLTAGPDPLAATRILTEAAGLLQRHGRTAEVGAAYALIEALRGSGKPDRLGTLAFGVYDDAPIADIMLDALDYGGGDWRRGVHFLELARDATPHDPTLRRAQALMAAFAHIRRH